MTDMGVTKFEPGRHEKDGVVYDYPRVLGTEVLEMMAKEVEACNRFNGWFEEGRTFGEGIALLHSEISEALEAYREQGLDETVRYESEDGYAIVNKGDVNDTNWRKAGQIGKPCGVASELADELVRLLDEASRQDIDLFQAFREKLTYNWTRGYRHGGKKL